ncbi:MAG: BolA family protein [Alphaproteobacteria bacterium]|nr:BolA family protein [Alphaproteobacteria bacterium]
MSIAKQMEEKLARHFSPTFLRIINDSNKHAGHLPEDLDESHLGIVVVSEKFAGMSRVDRSRTVHAVVADEIARIHAVTVLKTLTPEEYEKLKAV